MNMNETATHYDLVVVGAGIVGLATAWTARQRGLSVAVVERNAKAIGASVRNFGFITVTGQRRGEHWQRAKDTAAIWRDVAPQAGIELVHEGLLMLAQRPEAVAVLQALMATEMGQGCSMLSAKTAARDWPWLQAGMALLHSPHECRVESRDAIPRLSHWLAHSLGVDFFWNTPVLSIDLPHITTSRGRLRAEHCVVCPGNDLNALYPDVLAQAGIRQCTLQMMRVSPGQALKLPSAVMSDLSLIRYEGYADLPEAQPLKARLQVEQAEHLAQGIHLIVVQSADGSLVVGDSHVYGDAEAPFASAQTEDLIMDEFHQVLNLPKAKVTERWVGSYASAQDVVFKAQPSAGVALGVVTGGTGASTSFALARELLDLAMGA
jgi:D-hydroxyproline dehydrogenase subunit beta